RALLDRIEAIDSNLSAFLDVYASDAIAAAEQAEHEIASGKRRGPLHGIPIALKDVIDVQGQRTTAHSQLLVDNIASADAFVVRVLREAGAILIGKTACHEFATGGPSFDLPWPPARN